MYRDAAIVHGGKGVWVGRKKGEAESSSKCACVDRRAQCSSATAFRCLPRRSVSIWNRRGGDLVVVVTRSGVRKGPSVKCFPPWPR